MRIDTLKDLADDCYQQWLTTNRTDLLSGATKWIRDSLREPGLAGQIEEIFSAAIKPSEKCYRFLKLTGVIEKERLIQLLRKQALDELENEREQKLSEVDEQWWARVDEQRQRLFDKPDERAFPFFLFAVLISIASGFMGSVIGHNAQSLSADIGWRVGLLGGIVAAYVYRRSRATTLTEQFISSASSGVESQKEGIIENISDRRESIESDISVLIKQFSLLLRKSEDLKKSELAAVNATKRVRIRYEAIGVVLALLLIVSPSLLWPSLDKALVAKYCGIWEYSSDIGAGIKQYEYLKITKNEPDRFKLVVGYKNSKGELEWLTPEVKNADGIYLHLSNEKLKGEIVSGNFGATHGIEFIYRFTLDAKSNKKMLYSLWSEIRGETDEYEATKISD